jgi:hypothetical protein
MSTYCTYAIITIIVKYKELQETSNVIKVFGNF